MRSQVVAAVVLAVAFPLTTATQETPDFSGTWTRVVDVAAPQAGNRSSHTIKQTATEIALTLAGRDGLETQVYRLDGAESTSQTQSPEGPLTVTGKVLWDGSRLVIETRREVRGMTITTREVRTLDASGRRMTIDTTARSPQGETRLTMVFTKD